MTTTSRRKTGALPTPSLLRGCGVPARVKARPDPAQWTQTELMTLCEAAHLFWPDGPLTTTSLRTAVRDRSLDVAEVAGKILTSKTAIERMSVCKPRQAQNTESLKSEIPPAPRPLSDRELLKQALSAG